MSASGHRIGALTKELMVRWRETKESWRDEKALEFERDFLIELQTSVDKSLHVMEQLDKLLAKIRHECE
jgi:hypothetical protein